MLVQHRRFLQGMSIMEVIIVVGLFAVVMSVGVVVIIQSMIVNRNSEEKNRSRLLAVEGIEAAKSIQNTNWGALQAGQYGIVDQNNTWVFSGSSDSSGKYTRKIYVDDVYRNGLGVISLNPTDGILDPNVKRIRSLVEWSFNDREFNTEYETFLTNSNQQIVSLGTGLLVYAEEEGTNNRLRYKSFLAGDRWSAESTVSNYNIPDGYQIRWLEVYGNDSDSKKAVVTKQIGTNERIAVNIWDGNLWLPTMIVSEFFNPTYTTSRDFDGIFLDNGDFMIIFTDGTSVPRYRVWNGSSWANAVDMNTLAGQPVWIVVSKISGNTAIAGFRDSNQRTSTLYWNGSGWGNFNTHATVTSGVNYESIDFVYNNTLAKGALVFNEANDDNPNIKTYTSPNTWSGGVENVSLGARARMMRVYSNPTIQEFMGCIKDANMDIKCLKSNYTPSWSAYTTIADDTYNSSQISFDLGYEQNTANNGVIVYSQGEKRIPKYKVYTASTSTWSNESVLPSLGIDDTSEMISAKAVPKPGSDEIMFLVGGESGVTASVIWNGTSNSFYTTGTKGFNVQTVDGPSSAYSWYDFDWNSE